MSTIKEQFYFNFDGKESRQFNILAVDIGSNLYEEMLAPTRTVNQTQTSKGRIIFHSVQEEIRTFDLNLAFEEGFDEELIDDIARWLFVDYYRPLYFEGQEDRVMFAMIVGDSSIIHNGLQQGYFTITIQTNSPYLFSRLKTNTKTITNTGTIPISNNGHLDVHPELSIKKVGDGDLTIGIDGRNVKIINLKNGENIYIDTLREIIETDIVATYRYNNIVSGELEDLFVGYGNKEYKITGSCIFDYRFRERYRT